MVQDYSQYTIPTFSGINASPVAPTQNKGGNASFNIEKINQIANALNQDIPSIDSRVSTNETNISNLQSSVNNLQVPTTSQTVTLDRSNANDYASIFFGGSVTNLNLLIFPVPFSQSLFPGFNQNSNDLANAGFSDYSNSNDYKFININNDTSDLDISSAFKHPGMYLLIPYNQSTGSYSSTLEFPNSVDSSIALEIDSQNSKGSFQVRDITEGFSGNIVNSDFNNSPFEYEGDTFDNTGLNYLWIPEMKFDIKVKLTNNSNATS